MCLVNKLAVVVNTNSAYSDLWKIFFGQLDKFFLDYNIYVFTDESQGLPDFVKPIIYNKDQLFRDQYLSCLEHVEESIVLYLNDDYVLYDSVDIDIIKLLVNTLEESDDLSFIRFTRGSNFSDNKIADNLYLLDESLPDYFSQTASLWKKDDLHKMYSLCGNSHIGGDNGEQLEVLADKICKLYGFYGAVCYFGESKRGIVHYDSNVFPYIASALVRKKWNVDEYRKELIPLLEKYEIDINIRGTYGSI